MVSRWNKSLHYELCFPPGDFAHLVLVDDTGLKRALTTWDVRDEPESVGRQITRCIETVESALFMVALQHPSRPPFRPSDRAPRSNPRTTITTITEVLESVGAGRVARLGHRIPVTDGGSK
jgi:hypothetical protein